MPKDTPTRRAILALAELPPRRRAKLIGSGHTTPPQTSVPKADPPSPFESIEPKPLPNPSPLPSPKLVKADPTPITPTEPPSLTKTEPARKSEAVKPEVPTEPEKRLRFV